MWAPAMSAMGAGTQKPRDQKRHGPRKRIYTPTDCILTSNRESGNVYAVGVFNLGTVHALFVPLALLLSDSYKAGRVFIDVDLFFPAFGGSWDWLVTAVIVLLEFILTFVVYFGFLVWVACYRRFERAANVLFLLLLVVCVIVSQRVVFSVVFDLQLHPIPRVVCCTHQVVLYMKWISFINENAYKILYPWHKDDETGPAVWYGGQMEPQIGSFSSYVYFLFCPVLLYRDRYPRKPANLWKAFTYFIQFVMTILVAYVIFWGMQVPKSMHLDDLIQSLPQNVFLGFLQLYLAHICLMHGYMNGWAELLGFADQGFYQDWWNSCSLPEFLIKWNPVIHDWLKAYVHTHLKRCLPRTLVLLLVLCGSAFVHDILIGVAIGFYLPVYLVEYGIGGVVLSLKPPLGKWADQMIMSLAISFGTGIQLFLYLTELAARFYCPNENATWYDGLQLIDCYKQFNY